VRLIVRVVDEKVRSQTVALTTETRLSDDEKLEVLRRLDQFRPWDSLDEKRYCLVCGKLITGRLIKVVGDAHGNGSVRLKCPSNGCNSIPMDWMLPTDEVLASAKAQAVATEQLNIAVPGSADHANRGRLASHWRKFTFHFKRAS